MRVACAILFLAACESDPTCETAEETLTALVSFQLEASDPELSLMLVPAKPSLTAFEDLVPLSEPYRVLPADELNTSVELLPYDGPHFQSDDSELMLFLIAQFIDTDSSGSHETGEPILGLSKTLLGHFNRVGCGSWGGKFQQGWNALQLREDGPAPFSLAALDLPSNLLTRRDLALELTMESTADARVVLTPETAWLNQLQATPLLDAPAAESLTLRLPEEIPEDHLQPTDIAGSQYSDWFYGVELPLWIENQSAYDSFGADAQAQPFCTTRQEAVKVGHYPEADSLDEAFHLVSEDRIPGWGLYIEDPESGWRSVEPSHIDALTPDNCLP